MKIKNGANINAKIVKKNKIEISMPAKALINSWLSFSLPCPRYSEYIGINAWLKAPSAKNLLKTFGIFNDSCSSVGILFGVW